MHAATEEIIHAATKHPVRTKTGCSAKLYIYILLNYPEHEEESSEIIKNYELNTKENL